MLRREYYHDIDNIDNSSYKEIISLLRALEPVRNIFLNGLDALKNAADKFLVQPEVIIDGHAVMSSYRMILNEDFSFI